MYGVSETIVFRGHHRQIDRYRRAPHSLSILPSGSMRARSVLSGGRLISVSILFALPFCVSKLNLERGLMMY